MNWTMLQTPEGHWQFFDSQGRMRLHIMLRPDDPVLVLLNTAARPVASLSFNDVPADRAVMTLFDDKGDVAAALSLLESEPYLACCNRSGKPEVVWRAGDKLKPPPVNLIANRN